MHRVILSLKAYAPLTALIAAGSMFSDEAPEKAELPYLVISQEGEDPGMTLCGNNNCDRAMFDVMFYCKGGKLRSDIFKALRAWANQADTPDIKVLEVRRMTGFDNLRKTDSGMVELHVWLNN